ncbi:MAG: gliding motility-associated C-terminal domain-containing protein, partial [Luteibaculum sp.]
PGPYSIQMTSTSGCTYQFAGNIILQDTTLGTLDDIKAICNNDSVILEAHPGFQTYTWNTGDNSQSIKTNKPGKYLVEMSTFQGCIWRDSINLRQILNPLKNGFQQEQICEDSASNLFLTDTLNLTELDTISWLLDSSTEYRNTNHIKFQGQPGWHSLSLKINREDLCSFSLLDSIFIYPSFYPAPLLPDTFFCHLDSFQVQVAAIDSMNYRWSNGSVTEKANFKNPGEQYLIRELGACKDSIPFELEEIVIDNLHLKDTTICWYDSIFVGPQAQDQVSYLWSTADTTANIFIKTPDKYVLTATQENCKVVDSLILDYHRQAHVKLPPDTSICFFDTLTIGFADPKNHLWSTGETSDSIRVFAEGYYILTLTDSYCTERDTFYLDTLSAPSPFNFSDTSICWYDSLSLGVAPEPQVSYLWNTGDTDSQITLSDSGKYILRAELNSCQQSDSMRLNYHRETFLKLPEDTLICAGDSIRIGFADEKNHLWSTGEIADSIFIKTEGYFSLRVYDEYCSETDSIFIDTLAPPIIALREDTTVCQGAILSIGDEVYRAIYYNWNTGEEQNFIQVQKDGEYILNAFNGACWVADTFNLITYENPIIDYFKYTEEICKYDSFLVDLNCLNCIFLSDSLSKHKKTYYPGDTLEFRAVTPNSCYFYKRIEFEVKSDCYFVYVANAFSPDNDGVNEGFAPVTSTTNIAQYQFSIYNRWGEQIFTSSNIESSWDGTFNGREVQNDVYVWQLNLRFTDEVKTRQLRGTVQLLR